MATIKEIAKRAGVHVTTVSGILNETRGNSRASAGTEARVKKIAAELGYVPNRVARQLRSGRTQTVGLVAGDIRNPFFAELAAEMEDCLHGEGYELLLSCRGAGRGDPLADFLQKSVDGLVVWTERKLSGAEEPGFRSRAVVHLGSGPAEADRVDIDIGEGMGLALRHLKGLGCGCPGFFAPVSSRVLGLPVPRAALFESTGRGLGLRKGACYFAEAESWDVGGAFARALEIQRGGGLAEDGMVAFNDVYAMGWRMASRETGCGVPLVSFDGTAWVRSCRPAMAYVHIAARPIAEAAVALLLRRMANPAAEPEQRVVMPRLVAG